MYHNPWMRRRRRAATPDGGGISLGAGNTLLEIGDIILLESGDNLLLDNNIQD